MNLSVGVIVVTYNSLGFVERLIDGIEHADSTPIELRLIDNGSSDGSREWIYNYVFSPSPIRRHGGYAFSKNTGFTHAVNRGLTYFLNEPNIEYIALVNPDVIICDDWISKQLPIFTENPTCGIIGCRQVRGQEIIHGGGQIYADPRPLWEPTTKEIAPGVMVDDNEFITYSRFAHRKGHLNKDAWNVTEVVPWVTFACVFLRKAMVEEIGLLDERFFNYASDAEYCCRAWKYNWEVWYTANATVYHHVGASEALGGQEVKRRKIEDLRLFAQEEQSHASYWTRRCIV